MNRPVGVWGGVDGRVRRGRYSRRLRWGSCGCGLCLLTCVGGLVVWFFGYNGDCNEMVPGVLGGGLLGCGVGEGGAVGVGEVGEGGVAGGGGVHDVADGVAMWSA
ncbi:Uncharacterised protein [Jonesia denitrificans]|nr:Uncharacterised protein [Jonesia denitrificans]